MWLSTRDRELPIPRTGLGEGIATRHVAATGCRAVVQITQSGTVKTLLRSERPWSPTAVALHNDDVYVLEWTNANDGLEAGWRPLLRKINASGKVSTLMTITENVTVKRPRD